MSETQNEKETRKQRGILSTLKRLVMCEPKPTPKLKEPTLTRNAKLTIIMTDGSKQLIEKFGVPGKSATPYFKDFIKWWHCKTHHSYTFVCDNGSVTVVRDRIAGFETEITST